MKNIKLIATDLDGTLTQHRENIIERNREAISLLAKKYKFLIVGAGDAERIYNQINKFDCEIIGNYGMQFGKFNKQNNRFEILKDEIYPVDKDDITEKVIYLRNKYDFQEYKGDIVEFHKSGCITIPLIGTKAIQKDKLSFDPTKERRRKIYSEVVSLFPNYNVFVGGSSSFDMTPKPYNKYYALDLYCKEHGIGHDEVIYTGDDYGFGGNDESLYKSDFNFIKVDNYLEYPDIMRDFF